MLTIWLTFWQFDWHFDNWVDILTSYLYLDRSGRILLNLAHLKITFSLWDTLEDIWIWHKLKQLKAEDYMYITMKNMWKLFEEEDDSNEEQVEILQLGRWQEQQDGNLKLSSSSSTEFLEIWREKVKKKSFQISAIKILRSRLWLIVCTCDIFCLTIFIHTLRPTSLCNVYSCRQKESAPEVEWKQTLF